MGHEPLNRIEVIQGDITTLGVDAIINAANTSLLGGGGVDGAIHRAAGPELLAECRTLNGCPTGQARITRGYRLPAEFVIHTVGPIYSGKPSDGKLLSQCYQNSFNLALDNNIQTIAFPAVSCGVYGYPIEKACKIAVDTTVRILQSHPILRKVLFVLFSDSHHYIYLNYLSRLVGRNTLRS
jgi:O-acetyl-ADP-ribose deacetylase